MSRYENTEIFNFICKVMNQVVRVTNNDGRREIDLEESVIAIHSIPSTVNSHK